MENRTEKEEGYIGLTRIRIKLRTPEHAQRQLEPVRPRTARIPPHPPPDLRPGIDTEDSETRDRIYLRRLQTWAVRGRVRGGEGEESTSRSLYWMQVSRSEVAGQRSGISLSSPSSMYSISLYSSKLQSKFCIPPASLNCIHFGIIAKKLIKNHRRLSHFKET